LSILSTVPGVASLKRQRWTKSLIALTTVYISVTIGMIAIAIYFSPARFDGELDVIPATRIEAQVIVEVQEYLKTATHHGFADLDDEASICWKVFENERFVAEYLNRGEWRIHAWYERLRYFWRVDDVTLEVKRDLWLIDYLDTVPLSISC